MTFVALICLLGGIQGIFLTIHFWLKSRGIKALNRLVGVMLFVYSINLINTYTFLEGFQYLHNVLQPIGNYLGWWVGPSIYFYVLYPSKPTSWVRTIWIHYAPILLLASIGSIWPESMQYLAILYYLQFSSYLAVTIYKIIKGETDRTLLTWIKPFIYAVGLIKFANIVMVVLELSELLVVTDTLRISFIIFAAIPIFMIAYREMNATKTFAPSEDKYGDSGLEENEISRYFMHIKTAIEDEKLYLDPNLKLDHIAGKTGIQKRKISQAINESQDMNFSSFINDYRLKEVTKMLTSSEHSHLSILGIARDCGFNSGGRFNTLFKKKYGVTPSQYRKNHS